MSEEITIVVPIFANVGKEKELKAAIEKCAEQTRKEIGNVCYKLHVAFDNQAHFVIYEKWQNQAALDFHMEQPYLKELLEDKNNLVAGEIKGTLCSEFACKN